MKYIFSMKMAVIMLFSFGMIVGVATFIENDYGTQTAQALVYQAKWFEFFLLYFTSILLYNVIKSKSCKHKFPVCLFHLSFVLVAIGALTTRYIGYEGVMHIREGSTSSSMVSSVTSLQIRASKSDETAYTEIPLYLSSMSQNRLSTATDLGGKKVKVELLKYLSTAKETVVADVDGKKLLELNISIGKKGIVYYLAKGDTIDFGRFFVGYEQKGPSDKPTFLISNDGDGFKVNFPFEIETLNMNDQSSKKLADGDNPFSKRMLYRFGKNAIVLKDVHAKSKVTMVSDGLKAQRGKSEYMKWQVSVGQEQKIIVTRPFRGALGRTHRASLDGVDIELRVGAKILKLPFSIKLLDFQLERYPGSMTPASYASEVVLIDEEKGIEKPYRIYMNNILNHRNYRFFQSSYDQDEKGTVLSVNHDPGTWPTYIGYLLMGIGMLWSLLISKGRFQTLLKKTRKIQASALLMALISSTMLIPQGVEAATPVVDSSKLTRMQAYNVEHAERFSKLVAQDQMGRMKPVDTVAHEIVSKITGKGSVFGLTSSQIFLGMIMEPSFYRDIPMIKIGHPRIAINLGLPEDTKFVKFSDFFGGKEGGYMLYKDTVESSRKKPLDQSQYDKELIKVDERVNVAYMAYQATLLRIYPIPNDKNNKWLDPMEAFKKLPQGKAEEAKALISSYYNAVIDATKSKNWAAADAALGKIKAYQYKYGAAVMPSISRINMEIKYNKFGLFAKLVPLYLLLGIVLLVLAFINVIKPKFSIAWAMKGALVILIFGFIMHVTGMALRWYIAGHAPWSNAYESIVFIAASSVLAGIMLARKSPFALAATALLAGITMLVAHLSFINPHITTLVPVLKSYWLIIHVATIIAGDGFFGLGSILAFLVLILYIVKGKKENPNIVRSIKELTNLSEMALIIGLMLFTIGNFLGGVWANESWGRYWGWDPKETWAAVTILVYASILHLRFVPKWSSNFIYNMATTWAYFAVLMTYFGVNYYLSGLHSYAAGDPVPIPSWVYYAIAGLLAITVAASRNRKLS
ncbi:MAG: cytochrome c biogenesis protein CcsA [Sulfurovum sp.]|nr:cytochrome c biogenesis protein CcsA [Sulfurovum sp.]